jgi:non-heme chloroperoxidase
VTEIKKIPNRGHSLTIDSGWREVAETALQFVKRFVEPWRLKRGRVAVPARR